MPVMALSMAAGSSKRTTGFSRVKGVWAISSLASAPLKPTQQYSHGSASSAR